MNFEDFQKTGRDVKDLGEVLSNDDLAGYAGRIYLDSLYIMTFNDQWLVQIGRMETAGDLERCERILYRFAQDEEYIESDSSADEPFALAEAAEVVRSGVELLDCVLAVDDTEITTGKLVISTVDNPPVTVQVTMGAGPTSLAEEHGGVWAEHRDYPVADWQNEVATGATRNGYWEWVAAQIDSQAA